MSCPDRFSYAQWEVGTGTHLQKMMKHQFPGGQSPVSVEGRGVEDIQTRILFLPKLISPPHAVSSSHEPSHVFIKHYLMLNYSDMKLKTPRLKQIWPLVSRTASFSFALLANLSTVRLAKGALGWKVPWREMLGGGILWIHFVSSVAAEWRLPTKAFTDSVLSMTHKSIFPSLADFL